MLRMTYNEALEIQAKIIAVAFVSSLGFFLFVLWKRESGGLVQPIPFNYLLTDYATIFIYFGLIFTLAYYLGVFSMELYLSWKTKT